LWLGVKRVDDSFQVSGVVKGVRFNDAQWIVAQREMAIRDNKWIIADSQRLISLVRRLS
jgi:hypothetical protein